MIARDVDCSQVSEAALQQYRGVLREIFSYRLILESLQLKSTSQLLLSKPERQAKAVIFVLKAYQARHAIQCQLDFGPWLRYQVRFVERNYNECFPW